METKKIELPKGYLSFSAIQVWIANPERYKKLYFENDDMYGFSNAGMTYGSKVANALEHGLETGDMMTDTAMELLPKYDIQDKEIRATITTPEGSVDILGKPDSMDSKTKNFIEFKTGKVPWTQKKAEKTLQLKMYAVLIYLKYKVLLDKATLVWMETFVDEDGETRPTGTIKSFEVKLTLIDLIDTMALIVKVAKEIEAEWLIYEKPKEETLEEWRKNG